jgi:Transcriptional regulator
MLNNLNDLTMLVTVAESKGFTAAAKLQNTSPATVSKQIARIEKELGIRLFKRNTRHLEITEEGQDFVNKVKIALEILDEAQTTISQQEQLRGQLRITAPLLLGSYYIAPIVAAFRDLHPLLTIDLSLTDHIVDLYSQGIDIAIRIGELPDSNLVAKRLATNYRILVAAPSYLKESPLIEHPQQLGEHQCLLFSYPGYRQDQWTLVHKSSAKRKEIIHVKGHLSSDSGDVLKKWCLLGKGIALREAWEVSQDLHEGKLVRILSDWEEPGAAISILYHQRQYTSKKVSVFAQYLFQCWKHTS